MATATLEVTESPKVRTRPVYLRFPPERLAGKMSVAEWQALLERSGRKYEYIEGEVVEMAGASFEHGEISADTMFAFRDAIRQAGARCGVLGSDIKVCIHDRLYYIPDITILCGERSLDSVSALQNPTLIVEVLSPSTESDDRTNKFRHYQQIESLRYYLLIEQHRPSVTLYGKTNEGLWAIVGDHTRLSDTLTLTLDDKTVAVPLAEMYARVSHNPDFPPTSDTLPDEASLAPGNGDAQ